MAITVNIRYTGKNGNARKFAEEINGSGTVAAGLAVSFLTGKNVDIPIGQPSGQIIRAQIWRKGEMVTEGRISGQVSTDDRRYSINIGKG